MFDVFDVFVKTCLDWLEQHLEIHHERKVTISQQWHCEANSMTRVKVCQGYYVVLMQNILDESVKMMLFSRSDLHYETDARLYKQYDFCKKMIVLNLFDLYSD